LSPGRLRFEGPSEEGSREEYGGLTEARWRRLIELLEPFHGQAAATARRLCRSPADGDDLYQEAVLRAYEKLHTLRDSSRFRSWFYATLLSRHRTRARRAFWRRLLSWEQAFPDGEGPEGMTGEDWADRIRGDDRAARALATLAAEQREAIVLFEIDGYSIEEIAAMQQASIPAVKTRLARGRVRLRRWYERHGWSSRAGRGGAGNPEPERATTERASLERARELAPWAATASGTEHSDD